jgi:hypothetical protein
MFEKGKMFWKREILRKRGNVWEKGVKKGKGNMFRDNGKVLEHIGDLGILFSTNIKIRRLNFNLKDDI